MFGHTLTEFTVFDGEIINSTVDSELENINTPVDPAPTSEEEEADRLELEDTLNTHFNGHSFQVTYLSSMLMQLADKHYSAGKDTAASHLYEYSLKLMDDVEVHVANTLSMLARIDLRNLPETPTLQQRIDAARACRTTTLRFFDYFPTSTSNHAARAHTYLAKQLFKLFPETLSYDGYNQTVFDEAYASASAAKQITLNATTTTCFNRIAAWELGSIAVDIAATEGAPVSGVLEILNTSPVSLWPNSEDYTEDRRSFVIDGTPLNIPVFTGHTYTITISAKAPGMDRYDYLLEDYKPVKGTRMTLDGEDTTEETQPDTSLPAALNIVFNAATAIDREPSILVPAAEDETGVTQSFRIARMETRVNDYITFLNAAENSSEVIIQDGIVKAAATGESFCLTTAARSSAPVSYDAAAELGSRFSAAAGTAWHPMIYVSWTGAAAYCNWRSLADSLTPAYDAAASFASVADSNGYRLPTEAEWYKAAAWNPETAAYSIYGNASGQITADQVNYWNSGDEWETNSIRTSPAVSYPAVESYYGLHDVSGNVWEWTQDTFDATSGAKTVRGGSWGNLPGDVKATSRTGFKPGQMLNTVGFRIVITATQ